MKNIIITGASSGIGRALALAYAHRGASIALVARRADRLHVLAEEITKAGGYPHVIDGDVSSSEQCNRVAQECLQRMGAPHVLINNAGRGNYASIEDTTDAMWRSMFAINVDAAFYLTRALLPAMKENNEGHIVNVASVAGTTGFPYNAAYVASKHALVGFTAALRAELVATDIFATMVAPAGVITEWGDATEGGSINELYGAAIPRSRTIANERNLELAPLSKMMSAEECAATIVNAVDGGRGNDLYTHTGTIELSQLAVTNRCELEDKHTALWLAMQEVYESDGK